MNEDTIRLVKAVEMYPCLYDHSLIKHPRKDIVEEVWKSVASEMGWRVPRCKERWKNIRNGFVRSLKTSPNGPAKKPYYLHDMMEFLIPHVRPVYNTTDSSNYIKKFEEYMISESDVGNSDDESSEQEGSIRIKLPSLDEDEIFNENPQTDIPKETIRYNPPKKKFKSTDGKATEKPKNYREMFLLSMVPDVSQLSDDNFRAFKIKTMSFAEELLLQQQHND